MSLHGEGLSGRLTFEPRPSWTGGVVEEPDDDPLVGMTLYDTYIVSRAIGEGGMGRVYEARHTRISSKRYAIKVLHAEFARNAEIRHRFQHEAEAAAKIGHPGVVGTYDVGETPGGTPYMVCEYLAGEDLNDYLIERGPLPAHTVVHIGRQLCSALAAAHGCGVIHRDLKPHNVFVLGEDGPPAEDSESDDELPTVKVLDFGLSRFVERDNDLTKTGIILGTPGYMAPEQAAGIQTDHRTDIYGIGALLYATATGRAPFKEETPQKTVLSVLSQLPTRPRQLVPSIPTDLEIVIQRAMAREPEQRYQSAAEVEAALAQLNASSTPFDRRGRFAGGCSKSPRLQLFLLGVAWLAVGLPSLCWALLAVLKARGMELTSFRPSTLEWLLLSLLSLGMLFLLGFLAERFHRSVWKDSSRVAALLPRIKGPLIHGTLVYGVSALLLLSGWGIQSLRAGSFGATPQDSALGWFVVLPLIALLAASAAVIRDLSRKVKNPLLRALSGLGFSAGATVAALVILITVVAAPSAKPVAKPSLVPLDDSVEGGAKRAAARSEPSFSEASKEPSVGRTAKSGEGAAKAGEKVATASAPSENRERAPAGEFASAKSQGPKALERLLEEYPQDGKILEALVLLHASRADTLARSVDAISRLFQVEPELANSSDMLFILKKGLLGQGEAFKTAFSVVQSKMGTEGGELVYQLLNENPKQRDRLKKVFFELRKVQQVTPATAIAYDLRYATSCRGRIALLARAEKDGDLRSVHQLQALSTAPKRCGWGRKCQPLCPGEAKEFRDSIRVINQQLDAARR